MPIKVYLQAIDGKKREEVLGRGILDRVLPMGNPHFPMLRYVDPDSNTVFNGLQMYPVFEELDRLAQGLTDAEEKKILSEILRLATYCRDHPQLYLRFVGD